MKRVVHTDETKKVRAKILSTMKKVIAEEETSAKAFSDRELTTAIRNRGVWTTENITNQVRVEAGIAARSTRRAEHFVREYKNGQK